MDRLADTPELLDGPLDDPAALAGNLRDLRRLNRALGGVALSAWGIGRLADGTADLTVVDVGTGAADIPVAVLAAARREGRPLRIMAVEARAEVLDAARAIRPALERVPGLELGLVPPDRLPWPDAAFDVGHASLVLHHLEPDAAVAFLAELGRVSARGIVVNDLERGALTLAGAWLVARLLTRNAYTRHDAPLSVRRAYTATEVRSLLDAAGLEPIAERHALFRHRYAIVATRAGRTG